MAITPASRFRQAYIQVTRSGGMGIYAEDDTEEQLGHRWNFSVNIPRITGHGREQTWRRFGQFMLLSVGLQNTWMENAITFLVHGIHDDYAVIPADLEAFGLFNPMVAGSYEGWLDAQKVQGAFVKHGSVVTNAAHGASRHSS